MLHDIASRISSKPELWASTSNKKRRYGETNFSESQWTSGLLRATSLFSRSMILIFSSTLHCRFSFASFTTFFCSLCIAAANMASPNTTGVAKVDANMFRVIYCGGFTPTSLASASQFLHAILKFPTQLTYLPVGHSRDLCIENNQFWRRTWRLPDLTIALSYWKATRRMCGALEVVYHDSYIVGNRYT